MATAAARAAHLVVDREPWLFEDRLAAALLGDAADDLLAAHRDEVDHPATQAWKRLRLAEAAIPIPDVVSFVAVDFRVDSLADRPRDAGFNEARPAGACRPARRARAGARR
jgi:O-methyltransferase involved in polyketide biosynthesis